MTLHPHQHRALVEYLRTREETADEVFASFYPKSKMALRLATVKFVTQSYLDGLRPKDLERLGPYCVVTPEELARFPTGIPGFPNRLRREWFDAAWVEAKNGVA